MQRLNTVILIGCYTLLSTMSSISSRSIKLPSWNFRRIGNRTKQLLLSEHNTTILIKSTNTDQYAEQRTLNLSATATNSSKICWLIFFINSIVMAISSKPLFEEQYMKSNEKITEGEIYRLITPVFMHGSIVHFLCNSLSLYVYGPPVECHFGSKGFLFIYIFSGVFSNSITFLLNLSPYSIGSSGAIFGLVGAMITHFRKNKALLASRSTAEKGFKQSHSILPTSFMSLFMLLLGLRNIKIDLVVNLIVGNVLPNIDNWAHGFGLIGVNYSYRI